MISRAISYSNLFLFGILILILSACGTSQEKESVWGEIEKLNKDYKGTSQSIEHPRKDYKMGLKTFDHNNSGFFRKPQKSISKNNGYTPHKGQVYRTFNNSEKLKLDVYVPNIEGKKPLVVFFHGGGFLAGSKENPIATKYVKDMARLGYVSSSVNYRLIGINFMDREKSNVLNSKKAVLNSMLDAKHALQHLVSNSETFEIDTDNVFIAGFSAGGIIAINSMLMNDVEAQECFNLSSNDCLLDCINGFEVKGIISMGGAILRLSDLDDGDPPLLLMNGSEDKIVNPNEGLPFDKYIKDYELGLPGLSYSLGLKVQTSDDDVNIEISGVDTKLKADKWIFEAIQWLFTFKLYGSEEIYKNFKDSPYSKKMTYLKFEGQSHCFMREEDNIESRCYDRSLEEIYNFTQNYIK